MAFPQRRSMKPLPKGSRRTGGAMTPEMTDHLKKVEGAIQAVKPLLDRHSYPDDLRTVIVIGFIAQMVEHHEGMLLLICHDIVGSACVLARSIFESMYRGLWINLCATDIDIKEFVEKKDRLHMDMTQMASAIDEKYNGEGLFGALKNRCWPALCSYTHTGMLQLAKRFTGHDAEPAYKDADMMVAMTTVTTCILYLVGN